MSLERVPRGFREILYKCRIILRRTINEFKFTSA